MEVYKARSYREFLQLGLSSRSCFLVNEQPLQYTVPTCDSAWFKTPVDKCNLTGKWEKYDEDIERACSSNTRLKDRVLNTKTEQLYKNLFCAICNINYPVYTLNCEIRCPSFTEPLQSVILRGEYDDIMFNSQTCSSEQKWDSSSKKCITEIDERESDPPFSVLISLGSQSREPPDQNFTSFQNCVHDGGWIDPDGTCHPWRCSPGKILLNGNCSTAIAGIRGLGYRLRLLYRPRVLQMTKHKFISDLVHLNTTQVYLRAFEEKIKRIITETVADFDLSFTAVVNESSLGLRTPSEARPEKTNTLDTNSNATEKTIQLEYFIVQGYLVATQNRSRDDFEHFINEMLVTKSMTLRISGNLTLKLLPGVIHHEQNEVTDCNYIERSGLLCLSSAERSRDSLSKTILKVRHLFLETRPVLNCPYIIFEKFIIGKHHSKGPFRLTVKLAFRTASITFGKRKNLNLLSVEDISTLLVCQDLLSSKTDNNRRYIKRVQYILTLTCLSVSMMSLILTTMTYILFSELRNDAGMNNIFLCISLLLAQASLLAGYHVNEHGSYICILLGISIHYFWLSMFCWCFTCCFHMFRTFTSKTLRSVSVPQSKRRLCIKVLACSAAPALFVAVVITTSLLTSRGQHTGYGHTKCYLDSGLLTFITFIAPLCFILFCNFLFFIITVIKIRGVRKLQSRANVIKTSDQNDLIVYLKLSTVTGTFWVLMIIAEATDNDPLRFIAIFMNGLQGVFIFLSFICNKRVLQMLLHGIRTSHETSSPAPTDVTIL